MADSSTSRSRTVSYTYDNANRLASVTDWNSNATTYAYDDAGRMTTATLPSGTGIVSTYSYDDADRLTGITHVKGGSTTIASVAYTLDDVGNRTQSFPGRMDQQGTHSYSHDDLYRLSSVTYQAPSTTSYAFDAFGNRTQSFPGRIAGNTTTYAYDPFTGKDKAGRITGVTPPSPASVINYTWDDNGDQICANLCNLLTGRILMLAPGDTPTPLLHHTEPALGRSTTKRRPEPAASFIARLVRANYAFGPASRQAFPYSDSAFTTGSCAPRSRGPKWCVSASYTCALASFTPSSLCSRLRWPYSEIAFTSGWCAARSSGP